LERKKLCNKEHPHILAAIKTHRHESMKLLETSIMLSKYSKLRKTIKVEGDA